MIGNYFYFKGQNLMYDNGTFRIGISSVNRRSLSVSDDKKNYAWKHWSIVSPTYARWRLVVVEWYVLWSTRDAITQGMNRLDALFSLQWVPDEVELYEFKVVDERAQERKTDVKIDKPLEYWYDADSDHTEGSHRSFRVVLYAPDPRLFSVDTTSFTWDEGTLWGVAIWSTWVAIWEEWLALMWYSWEITVIGTSWTDEPIIITIEVPLWQSSTWPIFVYNGQNGTYFGINQNLVSEDVLVIDAIKNTLTLNGSSIMSKRVPWSVRPSVKGATPLVCFDQDNGAEDNFTVDVTYTPILF